MQEKNFHIPEGIVTNLKYLKTTENERVTHYTKMAVMQILLNQV